MKLVQLKGRNSNVGVNVSQVTWIEPHPDNADQTLIRFSSECVVDDDYNMGLVVDMPLGNVIAAMNMAT